MAVPHEKGDDYIRRIAAFIRANERNLAEAGIMRRRKAQTAAESASALNPLTWFAPGQVPPKAVTLSFDIHHLFYLLMRMEAVGLNTGTLDVQVESPSRPMSYINLFPDSDKSDTLSLASFRSTFSAVSGLSLGGGWWGRPEPPSLDSELKYIFSAFTKLPAISLSAPGRKMIAELANEPPNHNAIPLDSFKNIQSLECIDIDPRILLGWDKLAESLRSLKIKKSGLEDITDIFIGAVVDDQARREGSTSRKRRRRIPHGPTRQTSFYGTQLPDSVAEASEEPTTPAPETADGSPPPPILSSLKWAFLKHLFLSDNALTFFPSELLPYLTSLTHLDLSSNLLVSVPAGLGTLFNLVSLNLSDNMIDSVLGIYQNLGQVLVLNLSHNRLESICGLERLHGLERVDLRNNVIEESAEIGRLASLPNISQIWVEGNPLVEIEEGYRVACFDYFSKEGKSIMLDGSAPGFYEKRNLAVPPPEQMTSSRPVSAVHSPPTVAVGHAHAHPHVQSPPLNPADPSPSASSQTSPYLAPIAAVGVVAGKARRRKAKRIVDLDGNQSDGSTRSANHRRTRSIGNEKKAKPKGKKPKDHSPVNEAPKPSWGQFGALQEDPTTPKASDTNTRVDDTPRPPVDTDSAAPLPSRTSFGPSPVARHSRHSRYQTEYIPPSRESTILPSTSETEVLPPPASFARSRGSQTFSSKAAARRSRVTASVYEPPTSTSDGKDNIPDGGEIKDSAEAFRRNIEALKKDMGDGWLKVFSQSQLKTPS
jgi:hypothetical protein